MFYETNITLILCRNDLGIKRRDRSTICSTIHFKAHKYTSVVSAVNVQ